MATQMWMKGNSDTTPPGNIGPGIDSALVLARASTDLAIRNITAATVTGPVPAGVQAGVGGTAIQWWFQVNAVTISGAITKNLWGQEGSMNANCGMMTVIDRCNSSGTYVSTVESSAFGTEMTTSSRNDNWSTGTVTSTSFSAGDYIRVGIYITDAGGTMATGFTTTMAVGGGSGGAGTLGDAWVSFTETIVAYAPATFVPRSPGVDSGFGHF